MAMALFNGRKTITSAGTAEPLGTGSVHGLLYIKALAANTGIIEVGSSGTAATSGYQLSAKEELLLYNVENLWNIWVDTTVNGEGVCWIRLRSK